MSEEDKFTERFYEIPQSEDVFDRRYVLIKRIENITSDLISQIARKETPSLTYDDGKNTGWFNSYGQETESINSNSTHLKTLRFSGSRSRQRLALIMRIMSIAHKNLIKYSNHIDNDFYCTKRSLYYSLKNEDIKRFIRKKKHSVDAAITEITMILQCAPWEIGFITTSKGLVAGDLSLYSGSEKIINYDIESCRAVPDIVANVTLIRTTAEYVLVVEKDSVFQKLLSEGCPKFNKCILITGKGYPDRMTRMLVQILSREAELPVYALVDANPYGFEIMCVYRFGTINNSGYRENLICSQMRWLGVHQHDLISRKIPREKLTLRDRKKIESLKARSYINADFHQHLIAMQSGKAEIESISKPGYLTKCYIPNKIQSKEYL